MKRTAIALMALCLLWFTSEGHGQSVGGNPSRRVADAYAKEYIGGHKIVGELPKGYEDFLELWVDQCTERLVAKKQNKNQHHLDSDVTMAVCGRVVFKGWQYPKGDGFEDGRYLSYEFNEAYLKDQERPAQLVFDTNNIDGVHYHFEGAFMENDGKEPNQGTHLQGAMSKVVDGHKTSETNLLFYSNNPSE